MQITSAKAWLRGRGYTSAEAYAIADDTFVCEACKARFDCRDDLDGDYVCEACAADLVDMIREHGTHHVGIGL